MMNLRRPSKKAKDCVLAMSQGDMPTYGEFKAAWNDGLLDTTPKGEMVIQDEAMKLQRPKKKV
jgi:hypothetical protein